MSLSQSKSESYRIFDAIAGRYDFINTVLSVGLHRGWRRALRRALPDRKGLECLDLATGTADVAIELSRCEKVRQIVGIDLSRGMIALGEEKIRELALKDKIRLEVGDAQKLPYASERFDVATMSFGIRNVPRTLDCLREIHRVLKPGGRCLILEFALPRSKLVRGFHLFYLRRLLPIIGRLLSGHATAYTYLNETIEEFPHGADFTALMQRAGFRGASFQSLSFGIVNLYRGDKL